MQHAMKREIQTYEELNDCSLTGGVANYKIRQNKSMRPDSHRTLLA